MRHIGKATNVNDGGTQRLPITNRAAYKGDISWTWPDTPHDIKAATIGLVDEKPGIKHMRGVRKHVPK